MKIPEYVHHPFSYRDPSGFVFEEKDLFYRQVHQSYAVHYDLLIRSGLYEKLVEKGLLIPHTEIAENMTQSPYWYKTLLPRQLTRISYATEWSPGQLKDAAMLTLKIQQIAMEHGMILKDATPFNIQFEEGRPIFIDTLSFEKYDPSRPWIAYRQFCECFLFPLYLQHYLRTGTDKLMNTWPDGIPAAMTARLLPMKSRLNAGAWMHVFLQSHIHSDPRGKSREAGFSQTKLGHLIAHLTSLINNLTAKKAAPTAWSNYYGGTIMGKAYLENKERLFRQSLQEIEFSSALDLGANDGWFARILAERNVPVLAVDSDWQCIDTLYKYTREKNLPNILPLVVDISNPTPPSGFRHEERASFTNRARSGLVIALALLHHLSLSRNIPLPLIAGYLNELTEAYLIIEFIPLSDEKAQELIVNKNILPDGYDLVHFETVFSRYFRIEKKEQIPGTDRIIYRMKKDRV
jgi:hypothetical protein